VSSPLPPPVLLVGVGNDLRGDDVAGLLVARAVAAWRRPGVRVLERHQLLPELAADLAAAGSLVVVDAAVGGPDTATCEPAHPEAVPPHAPLAHGFRLPDLLTLAVRLNDRAPPTWVVSVPARNFDVGADPSAVCRNGISSALGLLTAILPS
jgi:hydrogenase maturation protease